MKEIDIFADRCTRCDYWYHTGQECEKEWNEDGQTRECWLVGKCTRTGEKVRGDHLCGDFI